MKIEIRVPDPGESIAEVQLANWLVDDGAWVEKDQEIAEVDSDKATLSIFSPERGQIQILVQTGETIRVNAHIATIDAGAEKENSKKAKKKKFAETLQDNKYINTYRPELTEKKTGFPLHISPLAKKMMDANNIHRRDVLEFFQKNRITKKDMEFYLRQKQNLTDTKSANGGEAHRNIRRQKMSPLRMKIANRLIAVRNETAMLTTFNEVIMTSVVEIRNKYKEAFKEKFGEKLGYMSFFTRAVTEAIQDFPQINSMIEGDEIIYYDYVDAGIAVSSPKGLVVPVLKNAEMMSFGQIEQKIQELAQKARTNKITLEELKGGTFTISNGGVFGSMLSTPILNPPQSAILGMHNIVERPVAVAGKVEIHPVMYVALSYDHRVIDGKESVGFLVKVKEILENPYEILFKGKNPGQMLLAD